MSSREKLFSEKIGLGVRGRWREDGWVRLPVDEIREKLQDALRACGRVLLKAPTGSGKSTKVPGMVADAGFVGRILVIEPRRMAARMLANWVAQLRGTRVGEAVGYAVRFDARYSDSTQIVFMTDGVFQRWMQEDPELKGVAAVIFDEFHERRLAMDVALARCLDLQDGARKDLKVVVMSATLETEQIAEFLAPAVTLEAAGKRFDVEVEWRPERVNAGDRRAAYQGETPIWERVVAISREAMAAADPGHVLIFLPGLHEIRKTLELLENFSWTKGWDLFPLYSGLPPAAQDAAVAPSERPKIIVATNVAETSLTIDGVRTVIDAGLARIAQFDAKRGIDTLLVRKISQAAAEQRAGRAGRTAPGRCYRLWSQAEHGRRGLFELPEVRRVDLSEIVLWLKSSGVREIRDFRWLDAPLEEDLVRAEKLLADLGALSEAGELTECGREMARLPLEPRMARLMLAGRELGCVGEVAFVAAAWQAEGIFAKKSGAIGRKDFLYATDDSDFAGEWRAWQAARDMNFEGKRCAPLGIMGKVAREMAQSFSRLEALVLKWGWVWREPNFEKNHDAFAKAMMVAFFDRIAVRMSPHTLACKTIMGRRGKLDDASCARHADALIATEITEVEGKDVVIQLRRAVGIPSDWLRREFPERISRHETLVFDDVRRRVMVRIEEKLGDLVLECKEREQGISPDAAAQCLAQKVVSGELELGLWDHRVEQWTARLSHLSAWMPELDFPTWGEEDRLAAIEQICHGCFGAKDLKQAEIWPTLREWLSYQQQQMLEQFAPEKIKLANGQSATIHYEPGRDPWIAVRVQHLFGVWTTPMIAQGRVPLLVHILAPNQRPWQMTKDLASFWQNGYAQMRKDLAGRYPRQKWPENPREFSAS